MKLTTFEQKNPNIPELRDLFRNVFIDDDDQDIDEWFDMEEMEKYLPYGCLFETRDEKNKLVGAILVAKQHPISWLDGKKMEFFILGTHKNFRNQGIATNLIHAAEEYAKESGAKSIIINTHILVEDVRSMYEQFGYQTMGTLKGYYDNGDAVFLQKRL